SSVLFSASDEVSESDLALRRLAETGGSARSQSRPPVMWVWAAILTIIAVIIAVAFWVVTMVPGTFVPDTSREIPVLAGVEQEAAIEELIALELVPHVEEIYDDEVNAGAVVRSDPEAGL